MLPACIHFDTPHFDFDPRFPLTWYRRLSITLLLVRYIVSQFHQLHHIRKSVGMAYFSVIKSQLPPQIAGKPILTSCHPSTDCIAVLFRSDEVNRTTLCLFDSQGKPRPSRPQQKLHLSDGRPECIVWHPNRLLLTIAWDNQKISSCDFDNNSVQEAEFDFDKSTALAWDTSGSFLCCGFKTGKIVIWETGHGGLRINRPVRTEDTGREISCLCFTGPKSGSRQKSGRLSAKKSSTAAQTSYTVLCGTREGLVYMIPDTGNCLELLSTSEPVCCVRFYEMTGSNVSTAYVMTENNRVIRYEVDGKFAAKEQLVISLHGRVPPSGIAWIQPEVLAVASVENLLRVWDLKTSQNVELSTADFLGGEPSEVIRTISFNSISGHLVAVTNCQRLLFWKFGITSKTSVSSPGLVFSPLAAVRLDAEPISISADHQGPHLAVADGGMFTVLRYQTARTAFAFPYIAVQSDDQSILILDEVSQRSAQLKLKSQLAIEGLAIGGKVVAVWGESHCTLYKESSDTSEKSLQLKETATFPKAFKTLSVRDEKLLALTDNCVCLINFDGTIKSEIRVPSSEGNVVLMDVQSDAVYVITSQGHLKMVRTGKIDGKQWLKSKHLSDSGVRSPRKLLAAPDGSMVAYQYETTSSKELGLEVWLPEKGVVLTCEMENNSEYENLYLKRIREGKLEIASLAWSDDPRLFVAHLKPSTGYEDAEAKNLVMSLFVTNEKGILVDSVLQLDSFIEVSLIGCRVPFIYVNGTTGDSKGKSVVSKHFLPNFKGFKTTDAGELKQLLEFCFFSRVGKIDKAIATVKNTENLGVWHHLAVLCVRSGRLEYAKLCLGKLKRADILHSLRQFSKDHSSKQLQLAHLASLLGLEEEAEGLARKSGDPRLLLNLKAAAGKWEDLLSSYTESTEDQLRKRETLYMQAKDNLVFGRHEEALQSLMEANCLHFDVPRLLLKSPTPNALKDFVMTTNDRKVLGWYGRLLETRNDLRGALELYEKSGNLAAVARLHCQMGNINSALELVKKTKDPAAAFQLAHIIEFEDSYDPEVLIELYVSGQAYGNAMRVCMKHDMDDRAVDFALKSNVSDMLSAAHHMDLKGSVDKAIVLYQKAGYLAKATDLAFSQGYYTNIEMISEDITPESNPTLVERCVAYFLENNQADRAANVLIRANQIQEAVELAVSNRMTIDSAFVTLVTDKCNKEVIDSNARKALIEKLIHACLTQGLYHDAARLLLDSGQPEAAMQALAHTGDIDAISRYIRIIRDPDALVSAGNILQSHPWHQKRNIFDAIVLAYKRAGAHLHLAGFYDSWGETACESGRYDIAKEAFQKSLEVLKGIKNQAEGDSEVEAGRREIMRKAKVVDYFLELSKEVETAPQEAIKTATELEKHSSWENGLRTGHLYGLIVRAAVAAKSPQIAKTYVRKLQKECPAGQELTTYVDENLLSRLK